MENIFIYPGTFCPPTYGHLHILKKACEIFPLVRVVCSDNDRKKDRWFPAYECARLWKAYRLPENARVNTLDELKKENIDPDRLTMIRGIRGQEDINHETEVMELNTRDFGISRYFFIYADPAYARVSSSAVRQAAKNFELEKLSAFASPLIISCLLEKILHIENLFLVVGPPASGKSTLMKILGEIDGGNLHIDTDKFSEKLKPLLREYFPGQDLVELALKQSEILKKTIGPAWLELLKDSLRHIRNKANVLVEIPYGLEKDKNMFRFLGGKIIFVGCGNKKINLERNKKRATPELEPFIEKIPGRKETVRIAKKKGLYVYTLDTNCSLAELRQMAHKLNAKFAFTDLDIYGGTKNG
ncbi:hypothetical protein A2303_00545 [Candidatus Falkowbacteria bacterium RIFOXYB2_FULL_47_14]|uniref:Phosphopantetheine adenylyltransferase n=1 Tax=Candidatus Falkowbacteria bacterium RIFOXYA2_FULL_47_19 TaxID=1797994 RepID=A0A1F5SNA6_9BACT|nr:MAG: hypothetical protein A2227_03950 [Candidatus Falkowbacteria bacterium RIFOXYA2_FULL_47_19]OGF34703.1 MAG: hypothetical protein A2468_02495 [Candidatus Falkowbacteria bacterium RIFOXYC2_FULL_46_15]OGF42861.1 MAG: hypothetical protein A2303_00545 [Candidatus Falkowbacteria bacterium RIFOXYB2_FULL_47_14]